MRYFFGAVVFDDPRTPRGGWASKEGAQPFRIELTGSLDTDVLWLCNARYDDFYKNTDLSLNPWLRHDGYLPLKISDILSEWGTDPEQVEADEIARFVSEVWSRIMSITMRLLKRNNPRLSDEEVFLGRSLKDDLRPLLPPAEFPKDEAGSVLRSGVGYLEFTKVNGRSPRGSKLMILRRPRLDHAINMLTTPIPVGPFDLYQGRELPNLRDLVESERPVLSNIVVRRFADPAISQVYAFGSQMNTGKRIPRTWVPHPELAVLNEFSTIEVQNAFIGKSYSDMASGILEFIRQFLESGDSAISWSCGVIAEALWRAAALGMEKRDLTQPVHEQPQTSWRGAWVNAADKIATFMLAMKVARAGHTVASYGYGTLYCFVPPEKRNDLIVDAWRFGLLPQMRDLTSPAIRQRLADTPWGGEARSKISARLLFEKKLDVIWDLDRIPLATEEMRKAILKDATAKMR